MNEGKQSENLIREQSPERRCPACGIASGVQCGFPITAWARRTAQTRKVRHTETTQKNTTQPLSVPASATSQSSAQTQTFLHPLCHRKYSLPRSSHALPLLSSEWSSFCPWDLSHWPINTFKPWLWKHIPQPTLLCVSPQPTNLSGVLAPHSYYIVFIVLHMLNYPSTVYVLFNTFIV